MRIVMFYHSLLSDWNHGNAHFLRGVVWELRSRGHEVHVYEPEDAWSRTNLAREHGEAPLLAFRSAYPGMDSIQYDASQLNLAEALDGAEVVLVHEWNDPALIARIGKHRIQCGRYKLLFHDTHHRAITDPGSMAKYDLTYYDGVLAFGDVLRKLYLNRNWTRRAWTWHEAADTRVFRPLPRRDFDGDVIWIGNWGDDERSVELHEFLLGPIRDLKLKCRIHGVRYPKDALTALAHANIEYGGWIANFDVPEAFARFCVTVHVPRRPYTRALPGIPTIRPFEALACGMPLISAPWNDAERLFTPGKDYLVAHDGGAMRRALRFLLNEPEARTQIATHGYQTILARHTCSHRVDELFQILGEIDPHAARPIKRGERRTAVSNA